jgi:RIO-like serine/threonine protein kinase
MTDEIGEKVLQAFDEIHSLGVMHNDVRRENILVSQSEGSVWIIDFERSEYGKNLHFKPEKDRVAELVRRVKNGEWVRERDLIKGYLL